MADDDAQSGDSKQTTKKKTIKTQSEKKEATRIRVALWRKKQKVASVKWQIHLEKERMRDADRRTAPKRRSKIKHEREKSKLRQRKHRNKIKEHEEQNEMLQKRKGLLKRKATLKKKNKEIELLKKQVEELES